MTKLHNIELENSIGQRECHKQMSLRQFVETIKVVIVVIGRSGSSK